MLLRRTREADRRYLLAGILSLISTIAAIAPVHGQTVRSGGDNARAMQELQQVAGERTALKADNAKLKDDVADLKKKLDKATAEGATVSARVKELEVAAGRGAESSKQANDALEKFRAKMQELIAHFQETALDLKTVEADRNNLRGQLEARGREYNTCVEHNVGLYEVGHEALDRLERHGFWSKVGESEPFTQLARARLDNWIDDYRQRLQDLRLEQAKKPAAGKSP
jgi:seryl-tRNA synthetase